MLVHSDQGSQYGSADYLAFMRENNLEPSMSSRGNYHDNAVAESFFATFKKRVIKRKIRSTREEAKSEIFNFIEMLYNPVKRHGHTGGVSPVKFEEAYFTRLEGDRTHVPLRDALLFVHIPPSKYASSGWRSSSSNLAIPAHSVF